MRSLENRIERLEATARSSQLPKFTDDEIITALDTGNFDQRHLSAFFEVVEPGILGSVIELSASYRLRFLEENFPWWRPYSPLDGVKWISAMADDITVPDARNIEEWREWLLDPIVERHVKPRPGQPYGQKMDIKWAIHMGVAKRVVQRYGFEQLQTWVRILAEAPDSKYAETLEDLIPHVEEEQWLRMIRLSEPMRGIWDWDDELYVILVSEEDI